MDYAKFEELVKQIVANLYDTVALEADFELAIFSPPPGFQGRRGEYIRQVTLEAIAALRPERQNLPPGALEWRPYWVLQRRYVEGMGLQEVAASLAVSERQMRRDQHRALNALTALLWHRLFPAGSAAAPRPVPAAAGEDLPTREDDGAFAIQSGPVELYDALSALLPILRPRAAEEGASLLLEPGRPVSVTTDRVILRQILISLLGWAIHAARGGAVCIRARAEGEEALVEVDTPAPPAPDPLPDTARYWTGRIQAGLERLVVETPGEGERLRLVVRLARHTEPLALVVDDQGAAVNLYRRLLAQSGWKVQGANRPEEALTLAAQMRPALIILDVMMPQMDGWEVLQTLKLHEETRPIPVLVCSAWEEPELSRSLGAAGFLKKPITLKSLQSALQALGLAP